MRLENDFLRFLGRGGLSAVFFNPAVENLNRINAGHPVFLVQQLEALRGVSKVHPHFSLRKQLNDNIETEIVRVAVRTMYSPILLDNNAGGLLRPESNSSILLSADIFVTSTFISISDEDFAE